MKVKFLAAFAAISLLSIVTVAPTVIFGATPAVANPCASKPNPCASKLKASNSVGGPLAKQLQGKPVVVDIYASWCPACKNIAPTVSKIKQQYGDKITFVTLDVSDKASAAKAEAKAKKEADAKAKADAKAAKDKPAAKADAKADAKPDAKSDAKADAAKPAASAAKK